jgi:hypothetical protein
MCLTSAFLRIKGVNLNDHPVRQELERVKAYIRKVNTAEQVPTDSKTLLRSLLTTGNLVVDKGAAQRMILHGIPKSQITSNSNLESDHDKSKSDSPSSKKRSVDEISSERTTDNGELPSTKKTKKGKSKFSVEITNVNAKGPKTADLEEKAQSAPNLKTVEEITVEASTATGEDEGEMDVKPKKSGKKGETPKTKIVKRELPSAATTEAALDEEKISESRPKKKKKKKGD